MARVKAKFGSVVLMSLLVVACAPAGATPAPASVPPGSAPPTSPPSTEKVTVTWWNGFTASDRPVLEGLVQKFNESQDRVVVQTQIEPWDVILQKLMPAYTAGQGPTLLSVDYAEVPRFASAGVWADLGQMYADGTIDSKNLIPALVDAGKYKGVQYGVPMIYFAALMYYNKALFRESGLDPERPPTNWDEMEAAVKALTKDTDGDGTVDQYGFPIATYGSLPYWAMIMWQNGGGILDDAGRVVLDDPKSIEAIDRWAKLVREEHVSPIGVSGADADGIMLAQKGGLYWNGPWMIPGFAASGFDWGLEQVPAGPAGRVTALGTVVFAIDAQADDAEKTAAAEFINFWTSQESQLEWADKVGFPPVRTDVTPDNPNVAKFQQGARFGRLYLPGVEQQSQITNDIIRPMIERILAGQSSAQDAMTQAAAEIRALLGQ